MKPILLMILKAARNHADNKNVLKDQFKKFAPPEGWDDERLEKLEDEALDLIAESIANYIQSDQVQNLIGMISGLIRGGGK